MNKSKLDNYLSTAVRASHLQVSDMTVRAFPFYDAIARQASFAVGQCAKVTNTLNGNVHTVVLAYRKVDGENDFTFWCGDKFLEGRLTDDEKTQRMEQASSADNVHSQLAHSAFEDAYASYAESAGCNFWTNWRRDKTPCSHTSHVLALLRDTQPGIAKDLEECFDSFLSGGVNGTAVPDGPTLSLKELAFHVPVLLEGDRGAGKTKEARDFARTHNYTKVEMGGHAGTEAADMLGYLVPAGKGEMVWKDGPLSEAFRKARTQKTVLIIDELLRIRVRELSILLTALSPDAGEYRLRTGRVASIEDGVAQEEELVCPTENLCIIATTNIGAEYAVDEYDPALMDRFVVLRRDTSEAQLRMVVESEVTRLGLQTKLIEQVVLFYKKAVEAQSRGVLSRTPNTRTLVRMLGLMKRGCSAARAVATLSLLWVSRDVDGRPVKEQAEFLDKLAAACFK